jgi:hypothetical protein
MSSVGFSQSARKVEDLLRLSKVRRAIWGAGGRALRKGDLKIISSFPMFAPHSLGCIRSRAALTIQSANQTFPLMLDLLSGTGRDVQVPVPIESFINNDKKRLAAEQFKKLCDRYGSDKATLHDYHLLYAGILAEQDSVTALLEVGLGTNHRDVVSNMGINGKPGASLRAFREFLPNARIYGADLDRRILFSEERITTFFVDQTDLNSFSAIADAVQEGFDLIIDDGLHSPNANLATLLFSLERLKIGGWLVIEDIAPLALPVWQVIAAVMPEGYDSHLVEGKNTYLYVIQRLS